MPQPARTRHSHRLRAMLVAAPVLFAHSFARCHTEKIYGVSGMCACSEMCVYVCMYAVPIVASSMHYCMVSFTVLLFSEVWHKITDGTSRMLAMQLIDSNRQGFAVLVGDRFGIAIGRPEGM